MFVHLGLAVTYRTVHFEISSVVPMILSGFKNNNNAWFSSLTQDPFQDHTLHLAIRFL